MKPLHLKAALVSLFVLGLGLVVYGVGSYSRPAGFIAAGILLSTAAALVMGEATSRKG